MRRLVPIRAFTLVLAAFVAAAGCTSWSGQSGQPGQLGQQQSSTPGGLPSGVATAPEGNEAFYKTPEQAPDGAKAGDLIWGRTVNSPAGSEGFAIAYWSTAMSGKLVPVTAVLFRPSGPAPSQPRAVLAWAHGTFGLGDMCAPSQGYLQGVGASVPVVQAALAEGLVFVATDYQGLGTPGAHPFMVSAAAGRDLLDSIRAAKKFAGADGDVSAVVMGQSQGGAATLFAAEEQGSYAPDVKLRGAVAIAPPSRMDVLDDQLSGGRYFGYVIMAIYGYESAYPALEPDAAALTPVGQEALKKVPDQCVDTIIDEYQNQTQDAFGTAAVLDKPDFAKLLAENDPGHTKTDVPIFIVHGDADDTIPVTNSHSLLAQYCSVGDNAAAKFYPDKGHLDVFGAAQADIVPWLRNRLAGTPATPGC